jgi:hypothetical protein
MNDNMTDDSLTIRGNDIPVKRGMLAQSDLLFYTENPRLYSMVWKEQEEPTQEEIYTILSKMEHVRKLVQSIKLNKGLIESIIVKDESFVVLEGNSRLAAYRTLFNQDPLNWSEIKVTLLPPDIDDSLIFSLLGEYHIVGKKDWAPFEQAGYLYRRHKVHEISLDDLAFEVGLSKREINHLIKVYQYMVDSQEQDINKWSYYDSLLRMRKYKQKVAEIPALETRVVKLIKAGAFSKASDLRDNLPKIIESGDKNLKKFADGNVDFEDAVEKAEEKGVGENYFKHLSKFRNWVTDLDVENELAELEGEQKSNCLYEIRKIYRSVSKIKNKLE